MMNKTNFVCLDNNGDDHYTSYRTEKAMAATVGRLEDDREGSQSPIEPLPLYQQRDNFFS